MVLAALLTLGSLAGCSSTSAPLSRPAGSSAQASPSRTVDRDGLNQSLEDQISHGSVSNRNIEAIVVRVDGATELERYWNSDAGRYRNVFSVTKSILCTLVGIALREGDPRGTRPESRDVAAGLSHADVG